MFSRYLFQDDNFFLDTSIIWLQLLNDQQILESQVKVLFSVLRLSSPVSGLGHPLRGIVQILLTKISIQKAIEILFPAAVDNITEIWGMLIKLCDLILYDIGCPSSNIKKIQKQHRLYEATNNHTCSSCIPGK